MAHPESTVRRKRRLTPGFVAASVTVIIVGAILRIWASLDALWLDEIWSLRLLQSVTGPAGILTEFRHDNNHLLNSLGMYLIGDTNHWWYYRIPAVLAGIATIAAAGFTVLHRGRTEALIAAILTSTSYFLVTYSSEARGYSTAVLFALLAFIAARKFMDHPGRWSAAAFALCTILGFLSHLSFLHFYFAAFLWSAWNLYRTRSTRTDFARRFATLHVGPIGFIVLLHLVHVRHMIFGGGPTRTAGDVAIGTVALTLGAPLSGTPALLAGVAAIGLFFTAIMWLWNRRADLAFFFLGVTLLCPQVILKLAQPEALFQRYFLICSVFFLLLLSLYLAHVWRRGRLGKAASIVVILLIVTGNAFHLSRFLRIGRGDYLGAMTLMAQLSTKPEIVIGGDDDFRNRLLVDFYKKFIPGKPVEYCKRHMLATRQPEWFLLHSQEDSFQPPPEMTDPSGGRFTFKQGFPYSGLSGWHWYVYQRLKD